MSSLPLTLERKAAEGGKPPKVVAQAHRFGGFKITWCPWEAQLEVLDGDISLDAQNQIILSVVPFLKDGVQFS